MEYKGHHYMLRPHFQVQPSWLTWETAVFNYSGQYQSKVDRVMAGQRAGFTAASWQYLLFLLLLSVASCSAQLRRDEKQLLLDLHNYYRASSNAAGMRRMVRMGSLCKLQCFKSQTGGNAQECTEFVQQSLRTA